ncbi:MAG TPA: glycosyltransferase [Roseiflexaceae bacterium]|nr:glycosyltransferase [Roseiflexaceae bacterium]
MKPRILILSTSAGSGHVTAARALEQVFASTGDAEEVVHKDALEFTNQPFRDFYSELYLTLVKRSPHLVGWWYDESDEPWRTDQVRSAMDRINLQPLSKFILEYQPHRVVCTHFLPAGLVAYLMEKQQLDTHLSIVTTDYDFHSQWLSKLFNRYFVAIDQTKAHLVALGIPEDRVTVSGIPIDPAYGEPVDRPAVLAKYRLDDSVPILVFSAGAVGGGPVRAIVEQLMLLEHDAQCFVICGRNAELRREIEALTVAQAEKFRILGYTNDMPNLMRVATLFIGKPGGLTASEAMAAGVPMVISSPIPGQEERNSDHLLENGVAIKINDLTTVAYKLDQLLGDPERLRQMRENTRRLGRPGAAQTIVDSLLERTPLPPIEISKEHQQRMVEVVRGVNVAPQESRWPAGEIALFDQRTGVLLGALDEGQFAFLDSHLERESPEDDDFYINESMVESLRLSGADAELLDLLQQALGSEGEGDVRWDRR